MKNQKGFSLVELLVVVIIIAIIAAIAIPNLLASRRSANEASAISSLRTYHSAQATYLTVQGGNQDYGTAAQLGSNQLVDAILGPASGTITKSGYTFAITLPAASPYNIYCATAAPTVATGATATGTRYFGVETNGVIYANTAALACADGDMTPAGNPIQ